jgi:hypothetical protein
MGGFKEIHHYHFEQFQAKQVSLVEHKIHTQLFYREIPPPFSLVTQILNILIEYTIQEPIYYQFTKESIEKKEVCHQMQRFLPQLQKYYLKCKHEKYLQSITISKYITILKQILKPYAYFISSQEKYIYGKKQILYTIQKKKETGLKKINSILNFD